MQIAWLLQALVGSGVVIISLKKNILKHGVQTKFQANNNEAKYEVIPTSLRIVKALGAKDFKLKIDSKLIDWTDNQRIKKAKEEIIQKNLRLTQQLVDYFDDIRIE